MISTGERGWLSSHGKAEAQIGTGANTGDPLSIRLDFASGARIGPGKVAALEEIARSGSISAAGRPCACPSGGPGGWSRSLEHGRFGLTRAIRATLAGLLAQSAPARRASKLPLLRFFVMRDSGAAESTIQDAGWNGGQPAWQLRTLSICANALSPT